MNLNYNNTIPIRGDASFRKFYRRKTAKGSSIIVYAKEDRVKQRTPKRLGISSKKYTLVTK